MKTVAASEFKTHCLALLDEVAGGGEELLILKRGRAVARLISVVQTGASQQSGLLGTMRAQDDLIEPPLPPQSWETEAE